MVLPYFFGYKTLPKHPKNLDLSYKTDIELLDYSGKVKTCTTAKFHRTDSVICSHSIEGNPHLIVK